MLISCPGAQQAAAEKIVLMFCRLHSHFALILAHVQCCSLVLDQLLCLLTLLSCFIFGVKR